MRILIADDDPVVRSMLEDALSGAGFLVAIHDNGDDAFEDLRRGDFRLAILDWDMPGMDGPDICRQLISRKGAPFIYIIMLTSRAGADSLEAALDSGASDFITKPFRPEELLARLRAAKRVVNMRAQLALAESQKLESIGRLAAGIAHEINTPTQYVSDNARFLQDAIGSLTPVLAQYGRLLDEVRKGGAPDAALVAEVARAVEVADVDFLLEEAPQAIEHSLEGLGRVTRIVRAMKDFSHPDLEEATPTDLNRTIESTVTLARNEWKYVAELELAFDPTLPLVRCQAGPFNQVILNVVINAAHAIRDVVGDSGDKGTITISTRRDGDWVEVRVHDTGAGIAPMIRSKVFDPFFTTKNVGVGTGQGLAIARAVVVEQHGGEITFETEPKAGTTFVIRLPLDRSLDSQVVCSETAAN